MPYQEVWVEPEDCEERHISDEQMEAIMRIYDLLRRTTFPRLVRLEIEDALDVIEPLILEAERDFVAKAALAQAMPKPL